MKEGNDMAKIRKEYRLPEEAVGIIEETKNERGFSTETEALIWILAEHKRQKDMTVSDSDKDKIAELVVDRMQDKFKKQFDRIRLASTFSERYSYIILDAINTMLYDTKATFLMKASGETAHKVIRASEENFKELIEKNKQIKDNDNLKRGE